MDRSSAGAGGGAAGTGAGSGAAGTGVTDFDAAVPESLDRDGDGLSNMYEVMHGLNPDEADSDMDGVSDLAEVVAGTDPLDKAKNPMANGNFYFISPYQKPPEPPRAPLVFATELQSADLFILVDTTGSMSGAIEQLKAQLSTTIVPEASKLVKDLQIGVGHFDDIPVDPYGSFGLDEVLGINQKITSDTAQAQLGVNTLALHSGNDGPESGVPALHALATGKGLGTYLADAPACADEGIGYACFRKGSVPIVLFISDAELHNGPAGAQPYVGIVPEPPTYDQTIVALNAIHARVISVVVGIDPGLGFPLMGYPPYEHMAALTTDTGAVGIDGKPFVFTVGQDAVGLDMSVIDAVRAVASQVPIEVSVVVRDDPSDSVDATKLIERVEPNTAGGIADPQDPTRVCASGLKAKDTDGDGHNDTFSEVLPGTPICFDVIARMNETVMSGADPTIYKAFIDVVADGTSVLDTREVLFLVPPATPVLE